MFLSTKENVYITATDKPMVFIPAGAVNYKAVVLSIPSRKSWEMSNDEAKALGTVLLDCGNRVLAKGYIPLEHFSEVQKGVGVLISFHEIVLTLSVGMNKFHYHFDGKTARTIGKELIEKSQQKRSVSF